MLETGNGFALSVLFAEAGIFCRAGATRPIGQFPSKITELQVNKKAQRTFSFLALLRLK